MATQEEVINPVKAKRNSIQRILDSANPNIDHLRRMCVLPGGLLTNSVRKVAWPLILGIKEDTQLELDSKPSDALLKQHRDYRVVELDVERLLKRYPPNMDQDDRLILETELKRIIMRTVYGTDYYYYQGFHDIAITVHLVLQDEDLSFAVLRKLCESHLHIFMMPTLVETVDVLQFIYPLLRQCDEELYEVLLRSNVGTMFALPWLITWYGHNIQENVPHTTVVRLCDLFIASDPKMPIYLGAAIVNSLKDKVLALPEDQAEVHGFLNYLPTTLSWESLINDALDLYLQFPPAKIALEAAALPSKMLLLTSQKKDVGRSKKPGHVKDHERWWTSRVAGIAVGVAVIGISYAAAKYYQAPVLIAEDITESFDNSTQK